MADTIIFRYIHVFSHLHALPLLGNLLPLYMYSFQHFVCLCVVLLIYDWGSSSVSNEDVWPSVTTIRLPCCRNAYDFTHSSLSLFLWLSLLPSVTPLQSSLSLLL